MGAPRFRRVSAPHLQNAGPEYQLTRAEVVDLVANRIPRGRADDSTTMRNKVSSRITYDVKVGKLRPVASNVFRLGDVVRWANARWPGCFDGLPASSLRIGESLTSGGAATGEASTFVLPGNVQSCHASLRELWARVESVEGDLREARREADLLRPDALAWRAWNKNKGHKRKP